MVRLAVPVHRRAALIAFLRDARIHVRDGVLTSGRGSLALRDLFTSFDEVQDPDCPVR